MQAFKYIAIVEADGRLTLPRLPLQAGAQVEIIILVPEPEAGTSDPEGVIGADNSERTQ